MPAPLWLRRLIRPLIPDRWMARRRLHCQSAGIRHNVDMVIAGKRARHWLGTTPDTYRVRDPATFAAGPPLRPIEPGAPVAPGEAVLLAGAPLSDSLAAELAAPLSDREIAAVTLAELGEPHLVERRRVEPTPSPVALAVRGDAWLEVGGAPDGPSPLPGLLERLRDAGRHLAFIPAARTGRPLRRMDPISGPATVVLSLVPLHDVGGGSRSAALALALIRRGHHVGFVSAQPSADIDLGLRFVHPRLEQGSLDSFDPDAYLSRLRNGPPLVVAGVPTPEVARTAAELADGGGRVVYDCIDDWSSPWLGSDWYDAAAERALATAAAAVTAAAPDLVDRLAAEFAVRAALVPNGVDPERFGGELGDAPDDFPTGRGPVVGYHGTLRAEWVDWPAVRRVAEAYPDARVVLIGEPPEPRPPLPPNVHFLGLKPHSELPGYVRRFAIGLVPFVLDPATHAASPIKVYEYLAAGVPVAATPLRSLDGLEGVSTDTDLAAAVAAALTAPAPDRGAAGAHSWDNRVAALLQAAGEPVPAADAPAVAVLRRPVRHFAKHERRANTKPAHHGQQD